MDKSSLVEKKISIDQLFQAYQDERSSIEKRAKEIDEECFKLAGEFRLVNELISSFKEPKKEKKNG